MGAFLLSPLGKLLMGALAGAALLAGVYAYAHHAGRIAERQAILERSLDLLRERNHVDEQTRNMDSAELCRALGGVWMPDDSRCE